MFLYSLGFGLAVSWLWLFYLHGPMLAPICALWGILPEELLRWFIGAMSLTYLILAQVVKIHSLRNQKSTLVTCNIVLSLGPLLTCIWPLVFAEYAHPIIVNALATGSGIAFSFFLTAWAETISISNLRQSSMMLGIAFFLASIITLLGQIVDYTWLLPLLTVFPFISLLLMLRQVPDTLSSLNEYRKTDLIRPFPITLIIPIVLIYMNGGIMLHMISLEQSYPQIFCLSYLSYTLFCPLASYILYRNENIDLRLIYRIILPLMLIGFLIFSFQNHTLRTVAFVLLQGASALLNMYIWLLIPYFARFSTRPAAVCAFGLFISIFSSFCGNMIVGLLSTLLFSAHNVENLAFIACIVSASTIFLFPDQKETFSGWQSLFKPEPEKQPSSLNEVKSSAVSSSLDNLPLSSREKEVLFLLLKGRNSRFISELLNISSNTVKFHTRNIYGKLYVSSRQELLTMFENE